MSIPQHIPENIAKRRFFALGLMRLGGAVLIAIGVLILNDKFPPLPEILGYIALIAGVIGLLLIPQLLYSRWRTPPDID